MPDSTDRNVRLQRVSTAGGGSISRSPDGQRCAVSGKESLRILRISGPSEPHFQDHKSSVGRGGHRIDCSRNLWDGSGLKIDSATTDVAWAHGPFNNKILTSARNGELIMWDLNKSGSTKYERRAKDHIRAIQRLSVSKIVPHYCVTGSADGDLRVWDLRDLTKSIMRIHHSTSIRSVVFSPSPWKPLQAVVGLENGSIYRWDLQMGQRGQLDRLPLAHTASVTGLDWCHIPSQQSSATADSSTGLGWIVSGALDRTVKVWDLTTSISGSHLQHKPTYTLHPSFPVRHVRWRPGYECEIAIVSNAELGTGSNPDLSQNHHLSLPGSQARDGSNSPSTNVGDAVEIWDVRRGWIPKWRVTGTSLNGGVTDISFGDPHAMWALHSSGMFAQIDLRDCTKPLDSMPRTAVAWDTSGSLAFIADRPTDLEIPFDDLDIEKRSKQKIKPKALGDRRYSPTSQNLGVYNTDTNGEDLDDFIRLAQTYVVDLTNRKMACELNGEIAFEAKKYYIGQIWMLFAAALVELHPEEPQSVPVAESAPFKFPSSPNLLPKKPSPGRNSSSTSPKLPPTSSSLLTPRKITPTSSASSSPLQILGALPPLTPTDPFLGRRPSVDSTASRGPSLYRRRSLSIHSSSPNDRTATRLRHVGEGALDDSDSSASGEASDSSEEAFSVKSSMPTATTISARLTPAHPSPLSRLASRNSWTEDEDGLHDEDASSPSPQSTDSETPDSEESPRQPIKPTRRSTKIRSRSSTVASLAAVHRPVVQKPSQSSLRTVVATETSIARDTIDLVEPSPEPRNTPSPTHQRRKSQVISELALNPDGGADNVDGPAGALESTERRPDLVRAEERRIYQDVWSVLRQVLEDFANEGDIQMCCMLTLLASKELGLSPQRSARFLEAYIDMLTSLQLHVVSANIRKLCSLDEVQKTTLVETTVHSSCGKCRKPVLSPWSNIGSNKAAYCASCRSSLARCSICRLPVRGLLFQCPICSHGGHQLCYRRYYLQHPMTELTRPALIPSSDTRGRSPNGHTPHDPEVKNMPALFGHPCATGCGHFCWVSSNI